MKTVMTFITNYYYIFLILTFVCGIAILGYKVQHKREKIEGLEDKVNDQMIDNIQEQNANENIING